MIMQMCDSNDKDLSLYAKYMYCGDALLKRELERHVKKPINLDSSDFFVPFNSQQSYKVCGPPEIFLSQKCIFLILNRKYVLF